MSLSYSNVQKLLMLFSIFFLDQTLKKSTMHGKEVKPIFCILNVSMSCWKEHDQIIIIIFETCYEKYVLNWHYRIPIICSFIRF